MNNTASIVLDLQKEILSPNCDIVNVLRKAHLIAVKLKLSDFDQWIQYELSEYPNKESCPEYRKVRGTLKYLNQYYGWYPIIIQNNEIEKIICEKKYRILFLKLYLYLIRQKMIY